jgi:hypothetical protein
VVLGIIAETFLLQLLKDRLALDAKLLGQQINSNTFCQNNSPKNAN